MAAEALVKIGIEASEPLERLLDDPDPRVRREARWAFGKINGKTVTESTSDTHIMDYGNRRPILPQRRAKPTTKHGRPEDRRTQARHRCEREVFYRFLGDLGHELWWRAEVRDVSATGLGLTFTRPTTTGARLTIDLHDAGLPRRAVARVVHCRRAGGAWWVGCTLSRPLTPDEVQALSK
jgi:hypothetical protein